MSKKTDAPTPVRQPAAPAPRQETATPARPPNEAEAPGLILGDQELESGQVAVRDRKQGDIGVMSLDKFKEKITAEKESRSL